MDDRISTLEQAAARSRRKPLSVRISGQVHFSLFHWDDGFERQYYVATNDNAPSRIVFSSTLEFAPGWNAGYYLDFGIYSGDSSLVSQMTDNFELVRLRYSFLYMESKQFGKFTIGERGGAATDLAGVNYSPAADIFAYYAQANVGNSMFLRTSDGRLAKTTWGNIVRNNGTAPGEGYRTNVVRYDSPVLANFKVSATWGEDNYWDTAVRYTGKLGDIKLDAMAMYGENTENGNLTGLICLANKDQLPNSRQDASCRHAIGIVSAMHEPSGIFANFAIGRFHDDLLRQTTAFANTDADNNNDFWAAEIGIASKWFDIGKTTIFGQHYSFQGGANARRFMETSDAANPFSVTSRPFSSKVEGWGGGIVQNISDANMDVFLLYRHMTPTINIMQGVSGIGAVAEPELEPIQYFMTGAIIRF